MIQTLIADYNNNVGADVLQFGEQADGGNSEIVITKGLQDRDGKVGWGGGIVTVDHRESSGGLVSSPEIVDSIIYSLRVEFDEDYLINNAAASEDGLPNYALRKIFAHEIGHGFFIHHDPDVSQVMFENISGTKEFGKYWTQVRSFFGL